MAILERSRLYWRRAEFKGIPEGRDEVVSVVRGIMAEFLGTTLVVLVWTGTILTADAQMSKGTVSLALGFIVAAMVFVTQQASGGHLNPTVTFGYLIGSRMNIFKGIFFIGAQVAGGIAGGAILEGIGGKIVPHADFNRTITTPNIDLNDGQALGVEILAGVIITLAALMSLHINRHNGLSSPGPICVGFSMAACNYAFTDFTGPGLNPARTLGPAVLTGIWSHQWIYWVGPLLGALIAALLFLFVFKPSVSSGSGDIVQIRTTAGNVTEGNIHIRPHHHQVEEEIVPVVVPAVSSAGGHEEIDIPVISGTETSTTVEVHREVEIR